MKPEVREQFPAFTTRFEGRIPWMYSDVKGLITIGLGCLIDPVHTATVLPFVDGAGNPASSSAIEAEWRIIKAHPELAQQGASAAKAFARLRLREEAIDNLARQRLEANELILVRYFPDWDSWPAAAQLGVLSMAWAMGAGFPAKWPRFTEACRTRDWVLAADACKMREEGNPGIVPRNAANRRLFQSCAAVEALPVPAPPGAPAQDITDDDRANVERLQALWFDGLTHPSDESEPIA